MNSGSEPCSVAYFPSVKSLPSPAMPISSLAKAVKNGWWLSRVMSRWQGSWRFKGEDGCLIILRMLSSADPRQALLSILQSSAHWSLPTCQELQAPKTPFYRCENRWGHEVTQEELHQTFQRGLDPILHVLTPQEIISISILLIQSSWGAEGAISSLLGIQK